MDEERNGLRRVRAAVLFFNIPFALFFSLGAFLAQQERFAKWSEIIYLSVAVYVLNIIVSLRGRASQENPFGVLYQIGRIYAWLGNLLILSVTLVSGAFLSFPLGIGLALASATGLWGLFYTDKRDVPPDIAASPKETPFEGKEDSVKEALTEEHKGLRRRKKWTTGAAEIFGYCALVCGIFIYMSLEKAIALERFVPFIVFGAFFLAVWLYMRKQGKRAAAQKEKFYEEYPKARPALRYMHPAQERRLVRFLPGVEQSLRGNLSGISYTPPSPVAVSLWRAAVMILGIVFFVFAYLAGGLFALFATEAFLPSDPSIMAGGVFAMLMGGFLLWRWKYYKDIGYLPPELRKTPRSLHLFERATLFVFAIAMSYVVSVHGVMRMLHERSPQISVLENIRLGDAYISHRSGLCMDIPEVSRRRKLLCVSRKAETAFEARKWRTAQIKIKTSDFGRTVKGVTLDGVYYPSTY